MRRNHILLAVGSLSLILLVLACSRQSRYRVLSFFFDGVPPPVEFRAKKPSTEVAPEAQGAGQAGTGALVAKAPPQYPHPPYREGKCASCHNIADGQLVRTVHDGLCLTCHGQLTESRAYLHGPAAANDCLVCHHYHSSAHPKVLLLGPDETCYQCHDRDDLSEGKHHEMVGKDQCVHCHDPHGSDNRFFLTQNGRADR